MDRAVLIRQAKEAWGSKIRNEAVYSFSREMRLVERIAKTIPPKSDLVVLGGGVGLLPQLMRQFGYRGRAMNLELATVRGGLVPTIKADIEEPFAHKIGEMKEPVILGAFSIEYTDTKKTTANIADALARGGKFVWVAHHKESSIVRQLRRERELTEKLIEYRERIFGRTINLDEVKKFNTEANRIFDEEYDLLKIRPTKMTDLLVRRNLNYEYGRVIIIISKIRFEPECAKCEYDDWIDAGRYAMAATGPLFDGIELTPDGIRRATDERVKLKKSEIYEFDFTPKAIICEFEKN